MNIKSYAQFNILLAFALSLLVGCSPNGSEDSGSVIGENTTRRGEEQQDHEGMKEHASSQVNSATIADTNLHEGAGEPKTQTEKVSISGAFIKELPPGKSTAAMYLLMKNISDTTQSLNYVHSPVAENIEVHRVIYQEGMMKMRQVKHLHINPGQKLIFEPGGYHLMLFGISDKLEVGSTFPVTLEFEGGVTSVVDVLVKPHG